MVEDVLDVPEMLTTCMLNMFFFFARVCTFIYVYTCIHVHMSYTHTTTQVAWNEQQLGYGYHQQHQYGSTTAKLNMEYRNLTRHYQSSIPSVVR